MATPNDVPYGQIFTPSTVSLPSFSAKDVSALATSGVRYVRLTWVDLTNMVRCRVIPIGAFQALLAARRPGVGITMASMGLVGAACAPGFDGTGEYLYVPDLGSLRKCGYAPGHASLLGWFQPKQTRAGESREVELCPRTQLRRVVEDARAIGIEFLVGIETEFILLRSTDPIEAVNEYPWSTTAAFPSGSKEAQCMEEIADALIASGIELLMIHAEAAPGQYECVAGPLPPLEAADAVILTRETIYNIAAKHGLRATLAPRLYEDNCGSSAHAHISVHRSSAIATKSPKPNPNTNTSTTMAPHERSFLQSLLDNITDIAAITLPTQASYARVLDGIWSGGTFAAWGTENRETLVRLTGPPGSHHFEIRSHDGTANPYLALAAILGTGLQGIKQGVELQVGECLGQAIALSEEERGARHITGRMPKSLKEARAKMASNATVEEVFGETFVKNYLSVNETMENFLSTGTPAGDAKKIVSTF
ncbi:glutamine synthetase/guanido kinase [Peniophora sp. CONT]|nr:glutamine synthetase/guanido kinase [Peniophora sp. CONT]